MRKMLRRLSERMVEQFIKKEIISDAKKPVYIYGCELLFSTAFAVFSIISIGLLTGHFIQTFIFLLAFMPIRTVANGYHASSYRNCFLLTNLIAFLCIAAAELGSRYAPAWTMCVLFMAAQGVIWLRGPFRSIVHPLKEELVERNRTYMHKIQLIETFLTVLFVMADKRTIADTVIWATVMVALMIYIGEKEEYKNAGNVGNAD